MQERELDRLIGRCNRAPRKEDLSHHWWRGSISGVLVAAGAFVAHRLYGRMRPEPFAHEFAVVALLGAIPGVALYFALMRGQTVGRDTRESR